MLRERAAAGVEVRIIFDDFGNLTRFSDASLQALQDAGVEVEVLQSSPPLRESDLLQLPGPPEDRRH